jgi:hypothetical protein
MQDLSKSIWNYGGSTPIKSGLIYDNDQFKLENGDHSTHKYQPTKERSTQNTRIKRQICGQVIKYKLKGKYVPCLNSQKHASTTKRTLILSSEISKTVPSLENDFQ